MRHHLVSDRPSLVPLVVEHTLEMAAPAATVWAVITDLARYPRMEPVRGHVRVDPRAGDTNRDAGTGVSVLRAAAARTDLRARPRAEAQLRHPDAAIRRARQQPLARGQALAPDRTRYVSHFELSGWLAPLVARLLGMRLRRGFAAMSVAIKARAETLHEGG